MSKLTGENIDKFINAYNNAVNSGNDTFVFEGSDVFTKYAQYVIEYANSTLEIGKFDGNKFIKKPKS
jgi:hypothetical protein